MANIAILIPTLKKGGAEKQASLLARALSPYHKVVLIIPFPASGLEKENLELTNLPQENIICFNDKDSGSKKRLYKTLKQNKISILFCYLTWPDFWGPIIGRLAGVKKIYQGLRNASLPEYKLFLEKFGNMLSTGAITNNYAGAEIFSKRGIKNQIVIPNCYLFPKDTAIRENKKNITVITVGRFVEQKDYPTAIKAMSDVMEKNQNVRFKIIGHGELESKVRDWVIEYNISSKTEILINPPNVLHHLCNADIYLSTSLFEGTSNSIMEALDASLPVVTTDVGDNNQLVKEGFNGFLTKTNDIEALSNAIIKLAESKELRDQMGINGNNLLKSEFGFERFRDRYLDLIP